MGIKKTEEIDKIINKQDANGNYINSIVREEIGDIKSLKEKAWPESPGTIDLQENFQNLKDAIKDGGLAWNESLQNLFTTISDISPNNTNLNGTIFTSGGDAANSFDDINAAVAPNSEEYLNRRKDDYIEAVLKNGENLTGTSLEKDNEGSEKIFLNLIMPKYSRRVEVEDLNRNFWVIGNVIDYILNEVKPKENPFTGIIKDIITEVTGIWQNIYHLWLAITEVEDKLNSELSNIDEEIKEIESGSEKTPLNIYLHCNAHQNVLATDTWVKLFGLDANNIVKFTIDKLYFLGEELDNNNNVNSITDFLKGYTPVENSESIINSWSKNGNTYQVTPGPDVEKTYKWPLQFSGFRSGGVAAAEVTFKNETKPRCLYRAYDVNHLFSPIQIATKEVEKEVENLNLKTVDVQNFEFYLRTQKYNQIFWDIFNYANYDTVDEFNNTVDIVQNRILYENLLLENDKGQIKNSDYQNIGFTCNNFGNLEYLRMLKSNKKDMAQIITDIASFNYVYRFKNDPTQEDEQGKLCMYDFIPVTLQTNQTFQELFYEFLEKLDYYGNNGQVAININGQALRTVYTVLVAGVLEQINPDKSTDIKEEKKNIRKKINEMSDPKNNCDNFTKYSILFDFPNTSGLKAAYNNFLTHQNDAAGYEKYLDLINQILIQVFDIDSQTQLKDIIDNNITIDTLLDSEYLSVKTCFRIAVESYVPTTFSVDFSNIIRYSANPFYILKECSSFEGNYSTSDDYGAKSILNSYSYKNPLLVEIISTGMDVNSVGLIYEDDKNKEDFIYGVGNNLNLPLIPQINRVMTYTYKDRVPVLSFEKYGTNIYGEINDHPRKNTIYTTMAEQGILQGFGILAKSYYPQIANDYLSAYLQPNFSNVSNYEFRFIDNPALTHGKFNINIINYTVRYHKGISNVGSSRVNSHFNCHNCSLNIPFNLTNTNYDENRVADLFSVSVPAAASKSFNFGELKQKNVYQITHEGGYIYRLINNTDKEVDINNEDNLAIVDGCVGLRSPKGSDQLFYPHIQNIEPITPDKDNPMAYDINSYIEKNANNTGDKWYDRINNAYQNGFFNQNYYLNYDIKQSKKIPSGNILGPIYAYAGVGTKSGTKNLKDMYISMPIPALPYYRVNSENPNGDSYLGYNSKIGIHRDELNKDILNSYHQISNKRTLYNQEYSGFNDIYVRDVCPSNYKTPKMYVDISVFSDLSTVFNIDFLKDETKIKFPGLIHTETKEDEITSDNINFNFIKIGNYLLNNIAKIDENSSIKPSDGQTQIEKEKICYVGSSTKNGKSTSYIYNFNPYSGGGTADAGNTDDKTLYLFKYEKNKITVENDLSSYNEEQAGIAAIKHYYQNNWDSWKPLPYNPLETPDLNKLNNIAYYITGIGDKPWKTTQQPYWSVTRLRQCFAVIPIKGFIYENKKVIEYEVDSKNIDDILNNQDKQTFTKDYEIGSKTYTYTYLIIKFSKIERTEGYFDGIDVKENGGFDAKPGRWPSPWVQIKENNGYKIKFNKTTTEVNGIIQTSDLKAKIDKPNNSEIEVTCGILDNRYAINNELLKEPEEKIAIICGDFLFKNSGMEANTNGNFYYTRRDNNNKISIYDTNIYKYDTQLQDVNNEVFENVEVQINDAIFTEIK